MRLRVFLSILSAYTTVAQVWTGTTIGNYVLGMEVRSGTDANPYPGLVCIALRETFGRLCSLAFWGGRLLVMYR